MADSGSLQDSHMLYIKGESQVMYVVSELDVAPYNLFSPLSSEQIVISVVLVQFFNSFCSPSPSSCGRAMVA